MRPPLVHLSGESLGTVAAVPRVYGRPAEVKQAGSVGGAAPPSSESKIRARRV